MSSTPTSQNKTWLRFALTIAIFGAGVSLYALRHHLQVEIFGSSNAACNVSEFLSCDRIAKSPFSKILGVPLGALGFAFFLSLILNLSVYRFSQTSSLRTSALSSYAIIVLLGVLTSLVLGAISFFAVGALCITCISFYLINAAQAVLVFVYVRRFGWFRYDIWRISGLWMATLVMLVFFYGYKASETKITQLLEDPKTEGVVYHQLRNLLRLTPKNIPLNINPTDGSIGDIWMGNPNAKIVFVEFIDYTCPICQEFAPDFYRIFAEYSDRVLFVMKHTKLGSQCSGIANQVAHEYACESAMTAFCAANLGRYQEFQKIALQMPPILSETNLPKLQVSNKVPNYLQAAKFIGLSDKKIERCLSDHKIKEKIQEEMRLAASFGNLGTPTIYINGWRFFAAHTAKNIRYELDYLLEISR